MIVLILIATLVYISNSSDSSNNTDYYSETVQIFFLSKAKIIWNNNVHQQYKKTLHRYTCLNMCGYWLNHFQLNILKGYLLILWITYKYFDKKREKVRNAANSIHS